MMHHTILIPDTQPNLLHICEVCDNFPSSGGFVCFPCSARYKFYCAILNKNELEAMTILIENKNLEHRLDEFECRQFITHDTEGINHPSYLPFVFLAVVFKMDTLFKVMCSVYKYDEPKGYIEDLEIKKLVTDCAIISIAMGNFECLKIFMKFKRILWENILAVNDYFNLNDAIQSQLIAKPHRLDFTESHLICLSHFFKSLVRLTQYENREVSDYVKSAIVIAFARHVVKMKDGNNFCNKHIFIVIIFMKHFSFVLDPNYYYETYSYYSDIVYRVSVIIKYNNLLKKMSKTSMRARSTLNLFDTYIENQLVMLYVALDNIRLYNLAQERGVSLIDVMKKDNM